MLDNNDTSTTKPSSTDTVKQIQWLEIHGRFNTTKTPDGNSHFVTKDKPQAAYLTELGGALTLSLEGHWHYLINRDSLELKEGELALDKLSITSQDGTSHDLEIHLLGGETYPCISKVDYLGNKDNDVLSVEELMFIQNAIEEAELDYENVKMEEVDLEDDLQDEEEPLVENLSENEPLMDEIDVSEQSIVENTDEDSQQEEPLALEERPMPEDEEEMLAKVHALILQKKEELRGQEERARLEGIKEEEQIQKDLELQSEQEEAQDIKDKEKKAAKVTMDGDEMLLRVQALMNAPKQLDLAEIEMVGESDTVKVQKEEPAVVIEESEVKEEVLEVIEDEEFNEACLRGKISTDEAEDTDVFKSNSYLEGFSLEADGSYCFEPHEISYEYLSEGKEEVSRVEVSLVKSNGRKFLGQLSLKVQRINGALNLSANEGEFRPDKGAFADEFEEMSLEELAGSEEEFSHHAQTLDENDLALEGHLVVVFDSLKDGAGLHSDGTLGITILLPRGAQEGEAILVNGSEFIITEAEAQVGKLLYAVYPDDEVEVSYRDCENNISDSIRAKANEQSVEILEFSLAPQIMGEVGAQSIHASLPLRLSEHSVWMLMDNQGKKVNVCLSAFGSTHIDSETGEIEYKYCEHSGLDKYGSSADNKICEKIGIYLDDAPYAQLEVNIHIQAQTIHGYSGQEIDSSTITDMKLLKIDKSSLKTDVSKDNNMREMLEVGLMSNKAKISKIMLEIYESKTAGNNTSEAKIRLQSLTDQKTHLEDKLNSLK
ncbi:MAG: hypothetical protein COA44_06280 [Arcobacter sp.]|nr:MAG: hypothetical protein COA44_06280 [Arcobacter sp.]